MRTHTRPWRLAAIFVISATAGCPIVTFDRSGIPLDDGPGNGDASTGLNAPPDATVPDAPPPPELIDDGLLVRYYMDAAERGQEPTMLEDFASDPLPLGLYYDSGDSVMSFTEVDENWGLTWRAAEGGATTDRASVALMASKLLSPNGLHGSTTVTIEVVVDIQMLSRSGWQLLTIGTDSTANAFSLYNLNFMPEGINELTFSINGTTAGKWDLAPFAAQGRMVLHAVVNSEATAKPDTVALYRNGVPLTPVDGAPLGVNRDITLALPTNGYFVLGNKEVGGFNFQGAIFYAALYSAALSDATIQNNVARLLVDDDRPEHQ